MKLATVQELEGEMRTMVSRELPDSDPSTARYLARLFSTAHLPRWEEIRWSLTGLKRETQSEDNTTRVFGERLDRSRRVGDGCLTLCAFYRGDEKPASIKVVPLPMQEPLQPIKETDTRRFAGDYEPTPLDRPKRFESQPIQPGLEIAGLGRASYNVAGLYSAMLGNEEAPVYTALSRSFLQIIAKLGPAILRKYLGVINPPQRVVLYTPGGEILFRLRHTLN